MQEIKITHNFPSCDFKSVETTKDGLEEFNEAFKVLLWCFVGVFVTVAIIGGIIAVGKTVVDATPIAIEKVSETVKPILDKHITVIIK